MEEKIPMCTYYYKDLNPAQSSDCRTALQQYLWNGLFLLQSILLEIPKISVFKVEKRLLSILKNSYLIQRESGASALF